MNQERDNSGSGRSRSVRLAVMSGLVVLAVMGALMFGDALSFETLRDNRDALIGFRDEHYLQAVGLFLIVYVAIVALSLPGATVATLTGGFLFATFPGVLYNLAGATLGATALFLAARWGFGERLAARMDQGGPSVRRIKEGIDRNQWSMLFLIRLLPAVPFFVANLIPALVGVPLYRFVVSTGLGILHGTLIFTSVGAGLGEVFARGGTPDLGIIFEPEILLPLLGLAALSALPAILRLFSNKEI